MRIALTGGSGGVGSAVITEALAQGHEVVSIDRTAPQTPTNHAGLRFVQADITDYDQLVAAFETCDAVVHLAAFTTPSQAADHIVHNTNVTGSYNALRAAVEHGITRVCQASSVNALGMSFSRAPTHDYFPLDEKHPTRNEDPYSLSKWICEQQADSFARRYEDMQIASLRFPLVVPDKDAPDRDFNRLNKPPARHLWSYTLHSSAARACLLSLEANFGGHEVFYITAADTTSDIPSLELAQKHFPDTPIIGDLSGQRSFISAAKAGKMLNWKH